MEDKENEKLESEVESLDDQNLKSVTKNKQKKNESKFFPIFLCIVGIISLILGIILTVLDSKKGNNFNEDSVVTNENQDNDTNKNEFSKKNIKNEDFYLGFEVVITSNFTSMDGAFHRVVNGQFDKMRNVYYFEYDYTNNNGLEDKMYKYVDCNNKNVYYSSDNKTWQKEVGSEAICPSFPFEVIEKVRENDDVKYIGNRKYSLVMPTSEIEDLSDFQFDGDVPVTVTFDEDGFLISIVVDLSGAVGDTSINGNKLTYEFNDINGTVVIIPEDIL